jgi:hypothetical protein
MCVEERLKSNCSKSVACAICQSELILGCYNLHGIRN